MPDVVGSKGADARAKLTNLGLVIDEGQQFSTQPVGRVESQAPSPGSTVAAGGTVVISISQGPAPVKVPDLVGSSPSVATTTLQNLGLVPIVSTETSGTDPGHRGIVVSTDPEANTGVAPGSRVKVRVGN